jgi:hypothetical protein
MSKQKQQQVNADAKSVNTGIECDSPGDVAFTTKSANAGNANINVASGGIDLVVESTTTHDNARNTVVDAINTSRNSNGGIKATAATGNNDTAETSVAGVADAVVNDVVANAIIDNIINKDEDGPVDVMIKVTVHMRTLFYKYQILSYLTTNYSKPEKFDTHAINKFRQLT